MSLHTPPPWSVFRELNYTPLERDRGERTGRGKKKRKRQRKPRRREKWSLLCFVWLAVWKYSFFFLPLFWHCIEQTSGLSTQMEQRLAPERELLYRALPWQQLNQVMMWGSLIVTNTVTGTWLSSCLGRSTQSSYRPILFPPFTAPLSVQLPKLSFMKDGQVRRTFMPPLKGPV